MFAGLPLRTPSTAVRALLLAICCHATSCAGSQPAPVQDQSIDLTAPDEPEPPPPPARKPKWCPKDDAACSISPPSEAPAEENTEPLDGSRSYVVELSPDDPVKGPALAPVTLIVFSDFQCPFCKRLTLTLAELSMEYSTQIRVVWKDLPLPAHAFAQPAALLGREAYVKGGSHLFWEVHDMLFTRQQDFNDETLKEIATFFELPWPPREQHQAFLDQTYEQVLALNVRSTPTTFVNGYPIVGAESLDVFEQAIERELEKAKASAEPR